MGSSGHIRKFFRLRYASGFLFALIWVSGHPLPLRADPGPEVPPLDPGNKLTEGARLCSLQKISAARLMLGARTEPTANQILFDARYYQLRLELDPAESTLVGDVTVRGSVLSSPLNEVELNLDDAMTVLSVFSEGTSVHFEHALGILRADLPRAYGAGETFSLEIRYGGRPVGGAFNFSVHAAQPMIWTLSAPYGARSWWPCKDFPEDKADSVDIRITVPTGLLTASNGVLRQQNDDGTSAFSWWHERHPIATYLVSLASHPYDYYTDWYHASVTDSMQISFYNFASSRTQARAVQARVNLMMTTYANRFGEYPFLDEKYGHAEFLWSGGMENQTITSLGSYDEMVVAHELSHQWWGDFATCKTYHDIWLNEGFAVYCEALWAEAMPGGTSRAYHDKMASTRYYGPGTIYVPDVSSSERIYDQSLSYFKGSWVVHMLRHVVGDQRFFQILREYRHRHQGGAAATEDLQAVAEEMTGLDLAPFFHQWLHEENYPIYRYDWTAAPGGSGWSLSLHLRQLQDEPAFVMPVDVGVSLRDGRDTGLVVQNARKDENFVLSIPGEPRAVTLDPDEWILRRIYPPLTEPSFDKPLLLVNGVTWVGALGNEMRRAYQARAFTGTRAFDFWDYFSEPDGGYPWTLPSPLGHGAVPGDVLGQYRTVIWLGNDLGGDTDGWTNTPLHSYLEDGGNVLLLSRDGSFLLSDAYREYLGVQWGGLETVYDYTSSYAGLTDLGRTGLQSGSSWFAPEVGSESTVLYKSVSGHFPEWGIGVVRQPTGGGTYNPEGGRFVFLSGRPYRWDPQDLSRNVDFILSEFMAEQPRPGTPLTLLAARPNPLRERSILRFYVPVQEPVTLGIWNVAGRRIRILRDGPSPAGWNGEPWDGRDQEGRNVSSGVYFSRLEAGGKTASGRVLVVR